MASPRGRSKELQLITDTFFDQQAIIDKIGAAKAGALSTAGAMVRGFARRLIREPRRISLAEMTEEERAAFQASLRKARREGRPRPKRRFANAAPGKPPFNKSGLLKDNILFGYESRKQTVYSGPIMIGGLRTARLLEHGGRANLKGSDGKWKNMRFRGNPFMQPALEQAIPKIPPLFKDVLKPDVIQFRGGGGRG